ncbi:hypothetical protein [Aggregatibacter kilianii]|uniref:hypothetical protein n=1 Tax=Aggregatibacter kilianii TaxID=2025884 RepID=UPI0013006D39|nr:hypothetical protein [Aggregatibacter kilianii]
MIVRLILWVKSRGYMLLAVLTVLLGAYGLGHRSASKAAEARRVREERDTLREAVNVKKKVKHETVKMSPNDARRQLERDWMRK